MAKKMVGAGPHGKPRKALPNRPLAAPLPPKPKASKLKGGVSFAVFAAVHAAVEAVASGKAGDAALSRAAARLGLSPRERKRAMDLADQVFRHWARLGHLLAGARGENSGRARLTLALRLFLGTQTTDLAALLRKRDEIAPLEPAEANALDRVPMDAMTTTSFPNLVRLECPPHLAEPLRRALGPKFAAVLEAALIPAPVTIRVNTLKGTAEEAIASLTADGVTVEAVRYAPLALNVTNDADVVTTKALAQGLIEIQNEASQLAAFLVNARPGEQVLDLCAGAGGKTLALAAAMNNKGHLVAADTHAPRLARAKQRLKRAGVVNAECVLLDGKWLKSKRGRFDSVLIDAPCSGTGSWRRNPDHKWTLEPDALPRLIAEQDALLDTAARMVKPGGWIVYATCSLLDEENTDRIDAFAHRHPQFVVYAAEFIWTALGLPDWPCADDAYFRVNPADHGLDGFFAAFVHLPRAV